MNTSTIFLLLLSYFAVQMSFRAQTTELSAVTDTSTKFIHRLYLSEWNDDPPSELDPAATSDASVRRQLCENISQNGVFSGYYGKSSIALEEMKPEYSHILQRVFTPSPKPSPTHYDFKNEYVRREFAVSEGMYDGRRVFPLQKTEFVFVCLLLGQEDPEESDSNSLEIFYVSKAYSVSSGIRVHRFIIPDADTFYPNIMLVDRAAKIHTRPDFNVELHYLELRKKHQIAKTCDRDPVCRLGSGISSGSDQVSRLCSIIVLTSSYFKGRVKHPSRFHYQGWFEESVMFRTAEGREQARGRRYSEWLLGCFAVLMDETVSSFYISRAYNPDQVFVLIESSVDEDMFYIENLCTNVSIVYDRHDFGEVET